MISLLLTVFFVSAAQADVSVVVNRATQTVTATIDGTVHTWPTSTGKRDTWTRPGRFGVQSLSKHHRSSKYNWAPMPYSIFFNGDVALHGTNKIDRLGVRDSHGCARLHPAHAKILFEAVERNGRRATITVL